MTHGRSAGARDLSNCVFGAWAVPSTGLTIDRVPESANPWMPFAEIALSFDGYANRTNLVAWANRHVRAFHRTGTLSKTLTLDDRRALVFFEQRRFHHFGSMPDGDALRYVEALLVEIRRRVAPEDER